MPIMAKVIMASVTYGKCYLSKVFIASLIMANVFKCYGKWKWTIVGIIRQPFVFKSPELKTLEWWISGLRLNQHFFLISRLNIAWKTHDFNLQINYSTGYLDGLFTINDIKISLSFFWELITAFWEVFPGILPRKTEKKTFVKKWSYGLLYLYICTIYIWM